MEKKQEKKTEKSNKKKRQLWKTNGPSIIGFVCSMLSVFGIGLGGIVGIVLGIIALVQIKHTKQKGKGWAIAAIIIGFIWGIFVPIGKQIAPNF